MHPNNRVNFNDFNSLEQQSLRPLLEATRSHLRQAAAIADGEKFITILRIDDNTAVQLTIETPAHLLGPIAYELRVAGISIEGEEPHTSVEPTDTKYLIAGAFHLAQEHITAFISRRKFEFEEPEHRIELLQFAAGLQYIGLAAVNMTFDGLIDPPQAERSFSGAWVLNLVQRYV